MSLQWSMDFAGSNTLQRKMGLIPKRLLKIKDFNRKGLTKASKHFSLNQCVDFSQIRL